MKEVLKSIQSVLKGIGLYTGALDGLIGYKTYNAVLSLKDTNGSKQAKRDIQKILADNRVYFGAIDGIFGNNSISAFNNLIPAPKVTDKLLKNIQRNCAVGFSGYINQYIGQFNIKTKADLCAFIANIIHESNGFNDLRENMKYSALNLVDTFPKYFKDLATARSVIAQGTSAVADVVYGGRMGNNSKGDGFKYRGGGLLHLTGARNYLLASIGTGVDKLLSEKPELIIEPEHAIKTALWFWQGNRCSGHANYGDFNQACRVVNGGNNGLKERQALHQKLWNTLF